MIFLVFAYKTRQVYYLFQNLWNVPDKVSKLKEKMYAQKSSSKKCAK